MTDSQWRQLVGAVNGQTTETPPVGFIIDSPWLPNWYGVEILDYFTNEQIWFEANRKAIDTFPDALFLPGFWSEFGMCTEPSAFGVKCIFYRNEFPFADKLIKDPAQIDDLEEPNPSTDGLLPFMLNRLRTSQRRIEEMGHHIRFSVSRGPLNVATFLMGTTEFLLLLKSEPERAHQLLKTITRFLCRWHALQRDTFPSIDGIMILDDIVGFIGEKDFMEFALPYMRQIFAPPAAVKLFHNDAECAKSIRHYASAGINLYNPGIFNTLEELRGMSERKLPILGTIPPRDVLAKGTPDDVRRAVTDLLTHTADKTGLVLSCAGGMPPGVSTANIQAFIEASRRHGS